MAEMEEIKATETHKADQRVTTAAVFFFTQKGRISSENQWSPCGSWTNAQEKSAFINSTLLIQTSL
jgi:hypothetical protein